MERALVVADDSQAAHRLARRAEELAAGTDADLFVVRFVDEGEYEDRVERAATETTTVESVEEAQSRARDTAAEFADTALDAADGDVTVDGVVSNVPEAIVDYAEEHDCDHVFVAGRGRSPAGKAIFGDVAQSVILNFDGPTTVRIS